MEGPGRTLRLVDVRPVMRYELEYLHTKVVCVDPYTALWGTTTKLLNSQFVLKLAQEADEYTKTALLLGLIDTTYDVDVSVVDELSSTAVAQQVNMSQLYLICMAHTVPFDVPHT